MAVDAPFTDVHGNRGSSLTPIGGNAGLPLIGALDGMLTNTTAIRAEVHNSATDLRIVNERTHRMSDALRATEHQTDALVSAISDAITSTAEAVISRLTPALDRTVALAHQAVSQAGQGNGRSADAPSGGVNNPLMAQNPTQGGLGPTGLGTIENPLIVSTADKQDPGATSSSAPLRDVPKEMQVSPISDGKGKLPQADEKVAKKLEGEEGGKESVKALNPYESFQRGQGISLSGIRKSFGNTLLGTGTNMAQELEGSIVQNEEGKWVYGEKHPLAGKAATDKDIAKVASRRKIAGVLKNYGGSIAKAETLGGGIGAALPGALGPIGLAVGAVTTIGNMALDQVHKQREANNQFIAVQGGGQRGAFEERGHEAMFRLGQRFTGGLNGEQADELFMGATRIGLQGDERQSALNFGTSNYRKFGMDVATSLQLISTASKNGETNLGSLAHALDAVSAAAKQGGLNAEEARKRYIESYQVASQTLSGNGTASTVAGAETAALHALPDAKERFSGINADNTTRLPFLRQLATTSGIDIGKLVRIQASEGGAQKIAELTIQQQRKAVSGVINPQAMAAFNRAKAQVGPPRGPDNHYLPEQIRVMADALGSNHVDPGEMTDIINGATVGMSGATVSNSTDMAVHILTDLDYSKQASIIDGKSQMTGVDASKDSRELERRIGLTTTDTHGAGGKAGGLHGYMDRGSVGAARRDYLNQVKASGSSSPLVEALLSSGMSDSITIGGKDYSLKDAIHDHLDELESGDGTFTKSGESVSSHFGLQGDKAGVAAAKAKRSGAGAQQGSGGSDLVKGSIRLSLDPGLARLIKVMTDGIVVNPNIPGDAYPQPGSRPTGST